MKQTFTKSMIALLFVALSGIYAFPAMSQTVNVTFVCNTSTNLDTLGETGAVQIRGAIVRGDGTVDGDILPGGGNISWSSASTMVLDNVGGDYWSGTFEMTAGDTLTYKFWTDLAAVDGSGTHPGGGWEGAFNFSQGMEEDTRVLIIGNADTTLSAQYYQPDGAPAVDPYWRPFETKTDSVTVYFRVNMGGVTEALKFDPDANGPLGVRGDDAASGGSIDWGTTLVTLSRETGSVDNGSFWSGAAYIPKDSIEVGSVQKYKFFVENKADDGVDWEGDIGDRTFTYTTGLVTATDTTLHWAYFNDLAPVGTKPIDSQVSFRVSTEALETLGLFDRGVGDRIAVIGAKGWDRPGDFINLAFVPALQEWAAAEPFTAIPNAEIRYKYFVVFDTSRVDPASDNYIENLLIQRVNDENDDSGWEEPSTTGGGDRTFSFANAATQAPPGDFGFDRQFFASVPANAGIPHDIDVTFSVNMAPAASAASNTLELFDPATDSVYIQPDGSMLALSQGYKTFGDRVLRLEDPDNDMIYTGTWQIKDSAWYQLGFVIAYGNTGDGYVNNGGGFAAGRRYYQFVWPTNINSDLTTEWPTEFNLSTIDWVEVDLPFEDPPNLTIPTSVGENGGMSPQSFALKPNYPNPFNPETTISFVVTTRTKVKIQIFNLGGQLVKTLVDEEKVAGRYTQKWRGDNSGGSRVASGIYYIRMNAGDFTKVRKMTLLR